MPQRYVLWELDLWSLQLVYGIYVRQMPCDNDENMAWHTCARTLTWFFTQAYMCTQRFAQALSEFIIVHRQHWLTRDNIPAVAMKTSLGIWAPEHGLCVCACMRACVCACVCVCVCVSVFVSECFTTPSIARRIRNPCSGKCWVTKRAQDVCRCPQPTEFNFN